MEAIVGQKKLVKILESYTLENTPRTMLFLGPEGCGKSWLAARFAEQLGLDRVNVEPNISADTLAEYFQCPVPKVYLIDLKDITEKAQNQFLKFIEEPSANMYIILSARSEVGILPTILNRCIKYHFEDYTAEELEEFAWCLRCTDPRVFKICKTPGQLNNLPDDNLDGVFNFCDLILRAIKTANYANTLSLCTKINTKDEPTKIDFNLFFEALLYSAFEKYKTENDEISFKVYNYTINYKIKAYNKTINKESFLLSYFDGLWRLTH